NTAVLSDDHPSDQMDGHLITQLYSARNVQTSPWFGWLIGGLNYHAVHHAFPSIPFDQLPEAYGRILTVLNKHKMPAVEIEQNYPSAIKKLTKSFALIPSP
ncbi:MAG: hypothetical protein F6K11_23585, partial [Leptolyngbya sp. SIO3F4]|nr:hypothetical protein [Leptolyngbya sp. SIO3F4]